MTEKFKVDPNFNEYINDKATVLRNPERNESERLGVATIFDAQQIADPNKVDHFIDPYLDPDEIRPWK